MVTFNSTAFGGEPDDVTAHENARGGLFRRGLI
jgi:hypothetical protein